MSKLTLYLGAGGVSPAQVDHVFQYLALTAGGVTAFKAVGAWKDPRGTVQVEPALRVECFIDEGRDIHEIADHCRVLMGQEAVLMEVTQSAASFVTAADHPQLVK